jgi:hypothetical protein
MKKMIPPLAALLALAPSVRALTVDQLTPDERTQYESIKDDSTQTKAFLNTRDYIRLCRKVADGTLEAKSLPTEPAEYNKDYASAAEQKIVEDAVFRNIMTIIGG